MSSPGFVAVWPHPFRALDDGEPVGEAVEVFQLRPDLVAELVAWSGGQQVLINGGPAVLLPGGGAVGLGDFAVRDPGGISAERADGFYSRFRPE